MIASRDLADLLPSVRERAQLFHVRCQQAGIDLLVTSTYRDKESQDALYAQGRTAPGPVVTNARGGESMHNYRLAFDVVPMRNGKCVWDAADPVWAQVGELGEEVGLEWAGRWVHFREYPHFQFTGGLTLAQLAKGEVPA